MRTSCKEQDHKDPYEQVDRVLRRLRHRAAVLPQAIEDDLRQEGVIGLLHATIRFDPDRNCKFKTYAEYRIHGAMRDYLRRIDPLSRADRRAVNRGEQMAHQYVEIQENHAAADSTVHQAVEHDERLRLVRKHLSRLDNPDRCVIRMLLDGSRHREIASVLRVSESRVSQIRDRAVRRLREAILRQR